MLNDVEEGWNHLKNESPKYPEYELQIEEIVELAIKYQLWISINFSTDNIKEIQTIFHDVKGFVFRMKQDVSGLAEYEFTKDEIDCFLSIL